MTEPYHLVLWDFWQLQDCERIDRVLAEHDMIDGAYLMHYAVNHPEGLQKRDQAFRARHTYQTPGPDALERAAAIDRELHELEAFNARVRRRQMPEVH